MKTFELKFTVPKFTATVTVQGTDDADAIKNFNEAMNKNDLIKKWKIDGWKKIKNVESELKNLHASVI